jgi:hypothetical protein
MFEVCLEDSHELCKEELSEINLMFLSVTFETNIKEKIYFPDKKVLRKFKINKVFFMK